MKSLSSTLSSFKGDASVVQHSVSRDPDIWPPPTPIESTKRYLLHAEVRKYYRISPVLQPQPLLVALC